MFVIFDGVRVNLDKINSYEKEFGNYHVYLRIRLDNGTDLLFNNEGHTFDTDEAIEALDRLFGKPCHYRNHLTEEKKC